MSVIKRSFLVLIAFFSLSGVHAASPPIETETVSLRSGSSDLTSIDYGDSVAVGQDYVVLGAAKEDVLGYSRVGSVYIYGKDNGGSGKWGLVKNIFQPGAAMGNQEHFFGQRVAISGNIIAVSAPRDDQGGSTANTGAVFLFQKDLGGSDNWGHLKTITASDAAEGNRFGEALSLDGNVLVVSKLNHSNTYVYSKDFGGADNWGEAKIIVGSIAAHHDVSNNVLAVARPNQDAGAGNESGLVHIYEKDFGGADNWGEAHTLTPTGQLPFEQFGSRGVAIDGKLMAVAAQRNFGNPGELNDGGVYVFEDVGVGSSDWQQVALVTEPEFPSVENPMEIGGLSLGDDTLYVKWTRHFTSRSIPPQMIQYARDFGGVHNWGKAKSFVPCIASETTPGDTGATDYLGNVLVVGNSNYKKDNDSRGIAFVYDLADDITICSERADGPCFPVKAKSENVVLMCL